MEGLDVSFGVVDAWEAGTPRYQSDVYSTPPRKTAAERRARGVGGGPAGNGSPYAASPMAFLGGELMEEDNWEAGYQNADTSGLMEKAPFHIRNSTASYVGQSFSAGYLDSAVVDNYTFADEQGGGGGEGEGEDEDEDEDDYLPETHDSTGSNTVLHDFDSFASRQTTPTKPPRSLTGRGEEEDDDFAKPSPARINYGQGARSTPPRPAKTAGLLRTPPRAVKTTKSTPPAQPRCEQRPTPQSTQSHRKIGRASV